VVIDNRANSRITPGNLQKGAGGRISTELCSSKIMHQVSGSGTSSQLLVTEEDWIGLEMFLAASF